MTRFKLFHPALPLYLLLSGVLPLDGVHHCLPDMVQPLAKLTGPHPLILERGLQPARPLTRALVVDEPKRSHLLLEGGDRRLGSGQLGLKARLFNVKAADSLAELCEERLRLERGRVLPIFGSGFLAERRRLE